MVRKKGKKKYQITYCKKYSFTKKNCKCRLSQKIKINIHERKFSPKQAIAISYSQTKKKYPLCKRFFNIK